MVPGTRRPRLRGEVYGREAIGPSPVGRANPASEHHLWSGADGLPLATSVTEATADDSSRPVLLLRVITPVWWSSQSGRGA